jgi:hypothetical protein
MSVHVNYICVVRSVYVKDVSKVCMPVLVRDISEVGVYQCSAHVRP